MPTVFHLDGFRFFFYANEGSPREPLHVHVARNGIEAKFWLSPVVHLAYNDGFDARTQRKLTGIVAERRHQIARAWDEFFGET